MIARPARSARLSSALHAIGVAATLLLACAALVALPARAVAQTALPHYDVEVHLDLDAARAEVHQAVAYTNNTGETLSSLVFHVTAAHYGAFDLRHTRVDEQLVSPRLYGIVLEVPLPRALAPGESTQLSFDFALDVPKPGNLRFGADGGVIALGNWYPVLSVYRTGPLTYGGRLPSGWDRHQQGTPTQLARGLEPGDPFFTDLADYDVDLHLSRPAEVAHSGVKVAADGGKDYHLRATAVREFALAVSDRYEVATTQVGGTTLVAMYLPEHRPGGQQYLSSASQALAWFNETLGDYPYPSLFVAETMSDDSAWVGQEYPQVVFISSQITAGPVGIGSYLSYLVVHEVLHQWFYGLVGNDQLYEPWVDEALTTQLSYRFLEAADGAVGEAYWQRLAEQRQREAAIWPDRPVNTSIYDYDDEGHYFAMVYRKGASFLEEVRALAGDEAYLAAIRAYTDRHRGGFATGRDLLSALVEAGGDAVRPLIGRYFSYPEYRATATPAPTPSSSPSPTPEAATPSPTPTPEPSPTSTAEPTATGSSTPEPSPTTPPPPTATAEATAEPTATWTPTPSVAAPTPEATPTPPAGGPALPTGGDTALAAAAAIAALLLGLVVIGRQRTRSGTSDRG